MRVFLILVAVFLLVQNAAPVALYLGGGLHYDVARDGEVVLLSTSGCSYCARMRSLLRAGGVPYRELDVERDVEGRQRFADVGGFAVPVLLVGNTVVRGYDPDAVRAAFARTP